MTATQRTELRRRIDQAVRGRVKLPSGQAKPTPSVLPLVGTSKRKRVVGRAWQERTAQITA